MKYKITLLITFLFSVLFFSSCCNKSVESARYALTDEDKSFIPYQKDQTVLFEHSSGYQFELKAFNVSEAWSRTVTEHCNENYISYQFKVAELFSSQPELYFYIMVMPKEFISDMVIQINNDNFLLNTNEPPTIDSLQIGNNVFKDVYVMEKEISDTTIIQPKKVFYNKSYGIIKIKMTNNEFFNIVF